MSTSSKTTWLPLLALSIALAVAAHADGIQNPGGSGGGAPSGPAGGDLTGTYPNPTLNSGSASVLNSGTLNCAREPAYTGDVTKPSGSCATTLAAGSAANLNSGTLAAARGGAGTINGALKGNGSGVVSQAACADLSNGTANCSAAVGQVPGIATNTAASAGNIGEILTASATGVSLTSGIGKTIISVSLTAGDWDVWCAGRYVPVASTTVFTDIVMEISATDNSAPGTLGNYTRMEYPAGMTTINVVGFGTPVVPLQLASTTTYYCTSFQQFSASTMAADAKITARRRR